MPVPNPVLPLFEADDSIAAQHRVLSEVRVVALRIVVAEVRATALSARQSGNQNGMGGAAQGLRFSQAAARSAARGNFGQSGCAGSLR